MPVDDTLQSIREEENDEDDPAPFLSQSVHKPKFEDEQKLPPVAIKKQNTVIPKPKPAPPKPKPADINQMRR